MRQRVQPGVILFRDMCGNRDEAISVIREYIEIFYNRQRRHSRLGNISPAAFREKYHQMAA